MTTVNIGKGIELEVQFDKLPPAALDHIMYIGARNILMDAHAGVNVKAIPDITPTEIVDQSRAAAEKKLAALMSGEVRVSSSREGDPVRAEALRMATDIVRAKIRREGKKVASYEPKAVREAAKGLITPELLEKARARVEETRNVGGDLAELGL